MIIFLSKIKLLPLSIKNIFLYLLEKYSGSTEDETYFSLTSSKYKIERFVCKEQIIPTMTTTIMIMLITSLNYRI